MIISVPEKQIKCNGVNINYVDEGKGQAMLFLHNGGGFWQTWSKQIEHFSTEYRVIALDWPSFGKSELSDLDLNLGMYTDTLSEFISLLKLDNILLFGNCVGAAACIKYTIANPSKISKLIVFNVCPGERLVKKRFGRWLLKIVESDSLARKIIRPCLNLLFVKSPLKKRFPSILFHYSFSKEDPIFKMYQAKLKEKRQTKGRIDLLFAVYSFSLHRYYKDAIPAPVLLFWGDDNKVSSFEDDGTFFEEQLGIKAQVIAGSGHLGMYEQSTFVNQKVQEYI
jgi:pimeloyl-ACP methyl ester carboxylesterase